jgi:CBS-domain-containing membrane protein
MDVSGSESKWGTSLQQSGNKSGKWGENYWMFEVHQSPLSAARRHNIHTCIGNTVGVMLRGLVCHQNQMTGQQTP